MFTHEPLPRYSKAISKARDYAGQMFSATEYTLTMTCQPDPGTEPTEHDLVQRVLSLLTLPHEQQLHSPTPTPIDHPSVAVIVARPDSSQVVEYGATTMHAVREFLKDELYLPVESLEPKMVRAPYFDGEQFDSVCYSEIKNALVEERGFTRDEARWYVDDRLKLALYVIDADELPVS